MRIVFLHLGHSHIIWARAFPLTERSRFLIYKRPQSSQIRDKSSRYTLYSPSSLWVGWARSPLSVFFSLTTRSSVGRRKINGERTHQFGLIRHLLWVSSHSIHNHSYASCFTDSQSRPVVLVSTHPYLVTHKCYVPVFVSVLRTRLRPSVVLDTFLRPWFFKTGLTSWALTSSVDAFYWCFALMNISSRHH